jgi:DNA-binding phage protein
METKDLANMLVYKAGNVARAARYAKMTRVGLTNILEGRSTPTAESHRKIYQALRAMGVDLAHRAGPGIAEF